VEVEKRGYHIGMMLEIELGTFVCQAIALFSIRFFIEEYWINMEYVNIAD